MVLEWHQSDWKAVTSGVPQGSLLGPLLFLVYVNDIPDSVQCGVKIFVNNTKLFSQVSSLGNGALLQADLDALVQWLDRWLMYFNPRKCMILYIGCSSLNLTYNMNGEELISTSLENDLDMFINADLKFRDQTSSAIAKATQILAAIRRSFALIDEVTLPLLFNYIHLSSP